MDIDSFIRDLEMMLFGNENSELLTEAEIDRNRLADVIARTAVFMGEIRGTAEAKEKLMGYYSALQDLSQGITHPIFRASKIVGAPPPSSEVWRSRATIAIALDYFLRAKISFDEALKNIKKVNGIQKLVKKGGNLETSVKNWRTILDDGSVQSRIGVERWKASRENLPELEALDEIERRNLLISEAYRMMAVATDEIAMIVSPRDAV